MDAIYFYRLDKSGLKGLVVQSDFMLDLEEGTGESKLGDLEGLVFQQF